MGVLRIKKGRKCHFWLILSNLQRFQSIASSLLQLLLLRLLSEELVQHRPYMWIRDLKRKGRDAKNFLWMKPMLEYQDEKRAKEDAGEKEPHLLHVVWRTKTLIGRPWWEVQIMEKFGLANHLKTYPVILKNIPSVNKRLMEVKHLVSIKPLTFPHGFPDNPEDYEHCYIKHNGEFIVKRKVGPSASLEDNIERLAKDPKAKWRLQKETVIKDCMKRRDEYRLLEEYHKPEYHYTKNQDGKEWRHN